MAFDTREAQYHVRNRHFWFEKDSPPIPPGKPGAICNPAALFYNVPMAFNLSDHPAAFLPPPQRSIVSAWLPHIPIVPILIQLLRPRTFVELGTHMGDSYLAFCRAFRDLGLPAHATAIDTWEGDAPDAGDHGRGRIPGA